MAIIVNDELKSIIGKDLEQLQGKLPADKDFVLVPKESHIPKERFDEVNGGYKEYKSKFEDVNKQYEGLKTSFKGNEELSAKLKELQDINTKTVQDYETKLVEREKDYSLTDALRQSGARNPKAVKALLDGSKIVYKDGKLEGAAEQLEALKKSDAYLFEGTPQPNKNPFNFGKSPEGQGGGTNTDDPIAGWFGLKSKK